MDAPIRTIVYSGTDLLLGGSFTVGGGAVDDYVAVYQTNDGISPVGRFKFEGTITIAAGDEIQWAQWRIKGPDGETTLFESELINEFGEKEDGVRVPGPDISMAYRLGIYKIELIVTTLAGTTTESVVFSRHLDNYVYFIPDGTETGDPFDTADTFVAPGILKVGNTYTITLNDQTDVPVTTNDTYFYRIYAILSGTVSSTDWSVEGHDQLIVDWGGTIETVDHPETAIYVTRAYSNANATSFTLVGTARNDLTDTEEINSNASHPAASSNLVNPDQVQVERELRIGSTLAGHQRMPYPSNWVDTPGTFLVEYANQGPTAWEYRYRFRYRDFRRDGVVDERGPVEVTSAWSSWTAWT